jgi:hypothetical protein
MMAMETMLPCHDRRMTIATQETLVSTQDSPGPPMGRPHGHCPPRTNRVYLRMVEVFF